MYTSLAPIVLLLVLLGTCLYAWFKGAAPERLGAAFLLLATIAARVIDVGLPPEARQAPTLIGEGLLALGFLVLAIRYASLWLGAAMILQGIQFSLHAFYIVMERHHDRLFAVVSNLVTLGIILCILLGTTIAWRRSRANLAN
jgi:hypothetical protein